VQFCLALIWKVHAGEIVSIIGPNGAGKSTSSRRHRLVEVQAGSIEFDGRDITNMPAHVRPVAGRYLRSASRIVFAR